MPFIEWRPTPDRNVEVMNDTADLYGYITPRRRQKEFKALDDQEVRQLEEIVQEAFDEFEEQRQIER